MRSCVLVVSGILLTALVVGAIIAILVVQPWNRGEPIPRFRRAAVAANGFECASIGRQILQKNGTAVDAAIATLLCEGLGCAQCMGLGGGFLATVFDPKTGRVEALNARERAPAAAHPDLYEDPAASRVGGLAVAVPGELRGYGELHRRYGWLDWEELVRPAAELCRKGHRVTEYMGRVLQTHRDIIKAEPSMSEVYVNPATGEVWNEGDYIPNPTLADTLDLIATEGPEAIHNGSLTSALVEDIRSIGGIITEEDLREFQAIWQEPIEIPLTPHKTMYSSPLPGSGSVLGFIVNMLNEWVGDSTDAPVNSPLYWHRIVETFKYAYAKRTGLGDYDRPNLGAAILELQSNLSNQQWAHEFRERVDDERTFNDWRHYDAMFSGADDHGTAQVVVIAPDGSAVSVTSTINFIWGAQRRSRTLGFMLNNEMNDFAVPNQSSVYGIPPSPANMLAPRLQPLSSMVPTIVINRESGVPQADLVIGAAGGTKITTQVSLAVMHRIMEGASLVDVVQKPRLHHQLLPMYVEHEHDFDPSIIESLKQRKHATQAPGPNAGFAAMVVAARDPDNYLVTQYDRRRIGSFDGF